MLIMPDPSLDPVKQMEMISGGKVGVTENDAAVTAPAGAPGGVAVEGAPTKQEKAVKQIIADQGSKGVSATSGMQRDFSVASIPSRTTMETSKIFDNEASRASLSLIMSPSFRYGLHTNKDRNKSALSLQVEPLPKKAEVPKQPKPEKEMNADLK